MKIFGYENGNDKLLKLEEISLQCTIKDLEKLISFFEVVKQKHSEVAEETDMCHSHLRDWDITWQDDDIDIVIVTKFKE